MGKKDVREEKWEDIGKENQKQKLWNEEENRKRNKLKEKRQTNNMKMIDYGRILKQQNIPHSSNFPTLYLFTQINEVGGKKRTLS